MIHGQADSTYISLHYPWADYPLTLSYYKPRSVLLAKFLLYLFQNCGLHAPWLWHGASATQPPHGSSFPNDHQHQCLKFLKDEGTHLHVLIFKLVIYYMWEIPLITSV